jgi:hypothetical protein
MRREGVSATEAEMARSDFGDLSEVEHGGEVELIETRGQSKTHR